MQFTKNAKGFTLIELLVVITIIGILAVGGTTVYTSQIQKARDTTRLSDLKAFQGAVEQVYADLSSYPNVGSATNTPTNCTQANATSSNITCLISMGFMNNLPKDPKAGQSGNGSALDYTYTSGPLTGVELQVYEVSMGLENSGNITSKASVDGGNDTNRYEVGNQLTLLTGNRASDAQQTGSDTASSAFGFGSKVTCTALGGTFSAATSSAQGTAVMIRGNCP